MLKRQRIILSILLLGSIITITAFYLTPLSFFSKPLKPDVNLPPYDYYEIVDEATNQSLMHVPVIVNVGDEVITEDNKRYQVVKIEQNRAYARFVEYINLEKYQNNINNTNNSAIN
ncbi:MAG: hypothetical protein H6Q74_3175 [Firmicutes bacterium]|nr:hypothetical protein [Bacillota bacterium]